MKYFAVDEFNLASEELPLVLNRKNIFSVVFEPNKQLELLRLLEEAS